MANSLTTNPIHLDTAGATSAISHSLRIQAIVVYPKDDSWNVILHDASGGDVIFKANEIINAAGAADRQPFFASFPAGLSVTGLYATTLSDCEALVYIQ